MKFLKWYSPIVVTMSILAVIMMPSDDVYSNFWGLVLFIPVGFYLWALAGQKEDECSKKSKKD